jgi:hypothetical protein
MYKVDTYFYESVDKYAKEEYTNTVVKIEYRGVEQLAARRAHNPKVVSSSLTPATKSFRNFKVPDFFIFGKKRRKNCRSFIGIY